MFDVTPRNKIVIKALNALIEKRVKKNVLLMPISVVTQEHLNLVGLDYFEAGEIYGEMVERGYIQRINDHEFKKITKEFFKEMEERFEKKIEKGETTPETIMENSKALLNFFGFDPDDEEIMNTDNFKELKDYKKNITGRIEEALVKSREIGMFKYEINLHKLREKIRNGRDFYNMSAELVDYDFEKYLLHIKDKVINIKPTENTPLGHYILKHIQENGIKETYFIDELMENNIIPDHDINTSKQYTDAARSINKRIKNDKNSDINDFFSVTKTSIKIKEKYTA
ncbi:MAG: hypothetical protein ACI870_000271 [Crocinitomicaceae bacterium]|jgi:hypothetical protein